MSRTDEQVRSFVLDGIAAGRFAPGTRLPTERVLSQTLSVTRTAVRNALAVLEGEGRVRRAQGSGTFVQGEPATALGRFPSPANLLSPANLFPAASPFQVMEARLSFEPQMARLVAANGTASDFRRFAECVERGGAATALEEFEHWDAAFHEAIAQAGRNPLIVAAYRLVTRAREQDDWGELKRRSLTAERRALYQGDHERILAALRERDAERGEAAIHDHLVRVRANLLGI